MRFQDKIIYKIIYGFMWTLGGLPKSWRVGMAHAMARIWYRLDRRHRVLAEKNLAMVFPEKSEKEIRSLAFDVFKHWGEMFFEIGWGLHLDGRNIYNYLEPEGLENLSRAYRKKKGVILITGHIGTWEILPACLERIKLPNNTIYRTMDFKPLDAFFLRARTRLGANMIPLRNSVQKIHDRLNMGESIAIFIDQNANTKNGTLIDFMGREAYASKGPALLSLATEAAVVPALIAREKDRYKMIFYPEIPLVRTGNPEEDIRINTQRYNKAIEVMVRRYPEQWLWVHDRWKTRRPAKTATQETPQPQDNH
ncbi:KDO2-lipid IV(A) lauroyltransferase [Desulfobotulus alkaliphilus]|uniref:KDO2-lipid IV(A) lauroyltransferase n=1 Tax=Desulfobotulus alkaliphilus TaxID=622671 RepID=A0A562RZD0_9BACT|nr:lysophospholipid acyltransferase family protein [Desulfobotulus alkaliphilus]TWI74288.1 KDO2-lipid IV(A) lauroyltransferase [Desulfobotulus alkaliphilus]